MKITSKGQVTIPQHIRELAGLLPGSEVEFSIDQGRVIVRKKRGSNRGRAIVDRMVGQGTVKMTTDQIMELTRGKC